MKIPNILYIFLGALLMLALPVLASTAFVANQGGTGTSTPSGILYGDNGATNHLNTVTIGSNLTFSAGTLSATVSGGGSGTVSTSTNETSGFLPYWTSSSATPALLGKVATTSLGFTAPITFSGTLGAQVGGVTGNFGCTTASSGVTGCLSGTDWNTFNGKQATLSATWPQILTGATLSFGGLSTSTAAVIGNIPYFSGVNTFANVATGTITGSGGVTATAGQSIIGSGLTIGCTTATGSVPGCLSAADWTTFNGKGSGTVTNVTGTYPIISSGGATPAISTAFGTTTNWGIGTNGFYYANNAGVPVLAASSSLNLPNSALANSTISGVSLGNTLAALTINNGGAGVASGGTYTGTAGVTLSYNSIGAVPTTRNINTTYPVQGGGDLSTDRTITSAFGTTSTIGIGNNFLLYTSNAGVIIGVATSSNSFQINFASTTVLSASGQIYDSGLTSGNCVQASTGGLLTTTGSACGAGGSGGGTWATTTSQVAGELINHPNNNTDVVVVGAAATTSAPFYIDPNATTPLLGMGTSSPFARLSIHGNAADATIATTLFAIGSSTASATTTLFSISNVGTIVTNYATGLLHSVSGTISSALISLTADVSGILPILNGGTNASTFSTSGNAVYYDGTRLATALTTTKVTTPYASTTALTIASEVNLPNSGTVPTLVAGDLYINTNSVASSSTAYGGASGSHADFSTHSMGMTFASSSLAYMGAFGASGSTTIAIANPLHSSTLQSFFCRTDVGTAWVGFGTGAATSTEIQCTSSGVATTLSTNNTWAGRRTVYIEVGRNASAPNLITVTADVEDSN